jgi:hypothetical protein
MQIKLCLPAAFPPFAPLTRARRLLSLHKELICPFSRRYLGNQRQRSHKGVIIVFVADRIQSVSVWLTVLLKSLVRLKARLGSPDRLL